MNEVASIFISNSNEFTAYCSSLEEEQFRIQAMINAKHFLSKTVQFHPTKSDASVVVSINV